MTPTVPFAVLRAAYKRAQQFAPLRAFYGQTGRMTWQAMLQQELDNATVRAQRAR